MRSSRVTLSDSLLGSRPAESALLALIALALFGLGGLSAATVALLVLTGPLVLRSGTNVRNAWRLQGRHP
jgi:hypothetical protein